MDSTITQPPPRRTTPPNSPERTIRLIAVGCRRRSLAVSPIVNTCTAMIFLASEWTVMYQPDQTLSQVQSHVKCVSYCHIGV